MKKFLMLLAVSLAAALLVTGCSAGGTGAAAGSVSSGAKKKGGTVTVGVTNEPDSLDPYLAKAAGTREILFNIFEGLVKPDSSGNMQPAVAESWTVSADASLYTFKLRPGLKFHNGESVTAQDVVYSLDHARGKDTGTALVSGLENIRSVTVASDGQVAVALKQADPDFLPYLTVAITPRDYSKQSTRPIGTGPFEFGSYSPQEQLVLKKNPDYWQKDRPYLDKVVFKIEANADAAFAELQAGGFDIFPYLSEDKAGQLKASYNILRGNMNLVQLLALNNSVKPLDDARVRQALCYATDPKEIITAVAFGYGTRIGTGMIPGLKSYYDDSLTDTYQKNTAKAKQLLAQAGYPNGFDLTITVPSNYVFHVNTAQVLVSQLKAVGVKASIKQVDWGTWLSQVYQSHQYQSTVIGLDGANLSPRSFLQRYVTGDSGNFINFSDKAYDTLYASTTTETDAAKRAAGFKGLEKILTQDAASVYIQDPAQLTAVRKNIGGYVFYPLYVQDMSTVYFK